MLTKGSKSLVKEFDKFYKLRRSYIIKLLAKHSKVYKKTGVVTKSRRNANNAMHHSLMNNLTKPKSQYWRKKNGIWECNGCVHK